MNGPAEGIAFPNPDEDDPGLKALYEQKRKEFSAADLQKFTEIDEGIPAEDVIAELEEIHRRHAR